MSTDNEYSIAEMDLQSKHQEITLDKLMVFFQLYKLDLEPCKSRVNRNCSNNARCLKGLGQASWLINQEEKSKECDLNVKNKPEFCFRGLKNLGATCYINTFLQLWFHNVNLRKIIYKWRPNTSHPNPDNPIICLQMILSLMQFSNKRFVDPTPFIKVLQLDESQEQDTHEFSSLFNSYIQNKLTYEDDKSIQNAINQQYCMKLSYIIKCNNCNMISESESVFYELLLRVKGFKTIEECIFDYLEEESLEGNNRYACQICNDLQDAKRFIQLKTLPPVLNLQLLRFESSNGVNRKISSFLKFPNKLDMSIFLRENQQINGNLIYNLFAVLIHEGQTAYSGHYITFIKKDSHWFKFNDENVEKLKDFNLKIDNDDDFQNNEKKTINEKGYHKSKNAYMLVYKLDSEPDEELPQSYEECNLPDYLIDYIEKENQEFSNEQEQLLHKKSLQRMDELNHQRLVIKIFSEIEVPSNEYKFDAINKSWLLQLFKAESSNDVPPILNGTLLCAHNKLDIDSQFKCISTKSADLIYSSYTSDMRLKLPEYFCKQCTSYRIYMNNLKQEMDNDSKEISNLLKYKNFQNETLFWIGKESFKKWKTIKLDYVKKQFNENHESESSFKFNDDLLCPHGGLCSDLSKRRLVRRNVWMKLKKYFPESLEFTDDSSPCPECLEVDKTKQIIRDKNMEIALIQRSSLNNLYNSEPCRYWSDLLVGQVYHIISTMFYSVWKKFLSHPNTSNSPQSLTEYESQILCHSHSFFLFPPLDEDYVGYDKNYLILDDTEWDSLTTFYEFSIDITVNKSEDKFELSPGFCQTCFTNYVQEQKQKRYIYNEVPIYVQKIISDDLTLNDCESSSKKLKLENENNLDYVNLNITKRSLRKRRPNNELEINVSSNDKLKDVKFKIMQHFNIATYDQVLIYNHKLLSSQHNNFTLSELEIEPYSTLILKVDDRMDENAPCGEYPLDSNGSEAGFKGTQLQLL